jgi:hypothetical protein
MKLLILKDVFVGNLLVVKMDLGQSFGAEHQ